MGFLSGDLDDLLKNSRFVHKSRLNLGSNSWRLPDLCIAVAIISNLELSREIGRPVMLFPCSLQKISKIEAFCLVGGRSPDLRRYWLLIITKIEAFCFIGIRSFNLSRYSLFFKVARHIFVFRYWKHLMVKLTVINTPIVVVALKRTLLSVTTFSYLLIR